MQKLHYPDTQSQRYIIAIGASAGGLEAIHDFFDNMPVSGSMSFIIIQHLSPHYKSLLVELVGRHTKMHVVEAGHDTEVEKGFVYVIPNDKILTISGGRLLLGEKHFEKAPNTAIDLFLKSLAEDQGTKGIAVILSGTGTDGTQGAKAIKEAGGLVLVQDPVSAKFDGMPNSAIEAGHADYILVPELMPEEIFTYINEEPVHDVKAGRPTEQNLPEVLDIILSHCGHDFHKYKSPTLLRRMTHRMSSIGKKNYSEYIEFLRTDSKECNILGNEFLINVTRFFRDKAAFAILQNDVLRRLVKEKKEGAVLKVWVTACSTGQEAYSIAIAIAEAQLAGGKTLDVKIFATDIDKAAIEEATKGSYPEAEVADIEPQLVQKYFTRQDGMVTVVSNIRKQIVFARQNILKDPPFIKNDLVSCRNMLIYMNPILQRRVFGTLQFGLNVGGYLFLGPSEMPGTIKANLEEVNDRWKLYKKVRDAVPNTAESYTASYSVSSYNTVKPKSKIDARKETLHDDFQDILTEEYGFAAVYIDEACEIKEGVGDFRRYLSLPEKIGSLNVLKMVSPEISAALNTAIRKARSEGRKVTLNHTRIRESGTEKFINLYVKPTLGPYTIIVFAESHKAFQKLPVDLLPQQHDDTAAYINELEEELKEARINLQMAAESMDTTNEELQTTNEELLSSNEELQSSNEELQSLNEELHTLNTEHQLRIKELIDLNDDLNNYFRSTQIGQVFVDSDLRIRKFNPTACR
jgi:two-component system CheB/CheR fusion protein